MSCTLMTQNRACQVSSSLPLTQSAMRAAGWMPVCSHALSTTMAPRHSPQQAALPLRCWVNTMVSKHKQTTGICSLFDSLPPITSWQPLPLWVWSGGSCSSSTMKLNFHPDEPEDLEWAWPAVVNSLQRTFLSLSGKGTGNCPHLNIAQWTASSVS